jgi:hypothetical protein
MDRRMTSRRNPMKTGPRRFVDHPDNPTALPRVDWTQRGHVLRAGDGTVWTIHHRRVVNGKRTAVTAAAAQYRVFESGEQLRRYDLKKGERRDLKPSLVDRQLQLATSIGRRASDGTAWIIH